jgi:hypothetical protein
MIRFEYKGTKFSFTRQELAGWMSVPLVGSIDLSHPEQHEAVADMVLSKARISKKHMEELETMKKERFLKLFTVEENENVHS